METKPSKTVGYITDIEGNYDYWQRYVAISKILVRNSDNLLELYEDCELVFGGDICDRGPGDVRVVRELLDLKRNYPDRVHFILGNRDVNKLRLVPELHEASLAFPGKVYWIDQPGDIASQSAPDRLKWILSKTMGAPGAFEYRRQELAELGESSTDEDVVKSYLDWMGPDGDMLNFLELGQIVHVIGDTLYLHGALKPLNIGWVPARRGEAQTGGYRVDNIQDWCTHINEFVAAEVRDFRENLRKYFDACLARYKLQPPTHGSYIHYWAEDGGYNHPMPGSRLLQYGMGWMPDKSVNPSAIYACYLNSASPQFTAKLVTRMTELAASTHVKHHRMSFKAAAKGAAVLRRLVLSSKQHQSTLPMNRTISRRNDDCVSPRSPEKSDMAPRTPTPGAPVVETSEPATTDIAQTCVNYIVTGVSAVVDSVVGIIAPHTIVAPPPPPPPASASAPPTPFVVNKTTIPPFSPPTPSKPLSNASPAVPSLDILGISHFLGISGEEPYELAFPPSIDPVGGLFADNQLPFAMKPIPEEEAVHRAHAGSSNSVFSTVRTSDNESTEKAMNKFLKHSGISKIFVGHQPRGDAPLVLRDDDITVISADTSYAVNVQWAGSYSAPIFSESQPNPLDNLPAPPEDSTRGISVCEIITNHYDDETPSSTTLQGRLSNGLDYDFEINESEYIGQRTASNWYVKASGIIAVEETVAATQEPLADIIEAPQDAVPRSYFLLSQLEGFTVKNRLVLEEDIHKEF